MSGKAYIVFWLDMSKGGAVESAGVYSEASPTMHSRDIIPVVHQVIEYGDNYGDASNVAKLALDALKGRFPGVPAITGEAPDKQDNHPTFYCGRCKQHIPHNCPATYPDPSCG